MKSFLILLISLHTLHAASFEEAVQLAKNGDTDRAIATYQDLLNEQGPSASSYYNLGLCYQQKSDTGRAVLAYERALALSPRATDVANNLKQLRTAASLPTDRPVVSTLPAGIAWLSRGEWTLLFYASLIHLVIGVIMASFSRKKKFRLIGIFNASTCLIVAGSIAWIIDQRKAEDQFAIVIDSEQSLLLSPFPTAEKLSACPPGTLIRIESVKDDYAYVTRPNTTTPGWLPCNAIETIQK